MWHLKECASTVAPFITCILNLSLTDGDFPSPWKHAIVTPLLKKAGLDYYCRPAIDQSQIFHTYQRFVRGLSIAR